MLAGLAAGLGRDEISSHSLRIGGATAMYHTTGDLAKVKRYGRWSSDTFHDYLWESREPAKGMAKAMAADTSSLTTPAKTPLRVPGAGAPADSQAEPEEQEKRGGGGSSSQRSSGHSLQRASLGASTALGATIGAAHLGQAAAAGELVAPGAANTEVVEAWLSGTVLVVTIPLWQLLVGWLLASGVLVLACWACWACGSRGGGGAEVRRLREARILADEAGAAKEAAAPEEAAARRRTRAGGQVFLTDVGVQGPVTYTGDRYLHTAQGFRRGGEVTREIAPYPRPRR